MTSIERHLAKFPKARPSTLRLKAKQESVHEQLRREIRAQKRRQFLRAFTALPSWVWRW